jgi:predicted nuclease of predicted toxin-antitoxin system
MIKFKLDEHFGKRIQTIFLGSGYDVQTVRDEGLQGASDPDLFKTCLQESRCLVTLDLDFSDVIRFPPYETPGIVILRPRKRISFEDLEELIMQLLKFLETDTPENQLWVVERDRIRIHKPEITE